MFDGRHCTKQDLELLIIETDKILNNLNIDNLTMYLKYIERFDQEIADKMRWKIKCAGEDTDKIKQIIRNNIEILKQNVMVDILEHQ